MKFGDKPGLRVPRYFFDHCCDHKFATDDTGLELASGVDARRETLKALADLAFDLVPHEAVSEMVPERARSECSGRFIDDEHQAVRDLIG